MKQRWLSLYVENNVGVLAEISGLFAGKNYNLRSLSVGATQQEDISHMTVCLSSDDATFRQIQEQLSRCIDVLRVENMEGRPAITRELMLIKLICPETVRREGAVRAAQEFGACIVQDSPECMIVESARAPEDNEALVKTLRRQGYTVEFIRSGAVIMDAQA